MGFLSRFEKKEASPVDSSAAIPTANHPASEVQDDEQLENGITGSPVHVTPKMEKQLIRKLDKRLVPLVMGLCMSS